VKWINTGRAEGDVEENPVDIAADLGDLGRVDEQVSFAWEIRTARRRPGRGQKRSTRSGSLEAAAPSTAQVGFDAGDLIPPRIARSCQRTRSCWPDLTICRFELRDHAMVESASL
jgi:hypothetical protein